MTKVINLLEDNVNMRGLRAWNEGEEILMNNCNYSKTIVLEVDIWEKGEEGRIFEKKASKGGSS